MSRQTQTPPPPTAPPVVPPPLPGELASTVSSSPATRPSLVQRLVRDLKLGGGCLLVGLVVGQSGLLGRMLAPSATGDSAVSELAVDPSEAPRSELAVGDASSSDVIVASGDSADHSESAAFAQAETGNTIAGFPMVDEKVVEPEYLEISELSPLAPLDSGAENGGDKQPPQTSELASDASQPDVVLPAAAAAPVPSAAPKQGPNKNNKLTPESIASMLNMAVETATAHPPLEEATCANMESHGTVLKWAENPAQAYEMAAQQSKLVYMIHVSGNFEIPGFT